MNQQNTNMANGHTSQFAIIAFKSLKSFDLMSKRTVDFYF